MGVAVSSSHVVSAAPSSSGGRLLTLFPCSSVRSLPWETVLHKLLQSESFPWAAALHELPQHGSSHRVQSFKNRLLQRGSPMGSQALPGNLLRYGLLSPWVHRSWQEPAPARAPHGVTASFRHPPALAWGPFHGVPSMGYRCISAPPWTSLHCMGTTFLTIVFITSCKGKLSAPASRAPPPPSVFTALGVCRVVSSTSSHSSLSTVVSLQFFSPS